MSTCPRCQGLVIETRYERKCFNCGWDALSVSTTQPLPVPVDDRAPTPLGRVSRLTQQRQSDAQRRRVSKERAKKHLRKNRFRFN